MDQKKGFESITTCAGPVAGSACGIAAKLGRFGEATAQTFQQLRVKRVARIGERIVTPRTLLTNTDEAGATEIRQVARRRRLRDSENGNEIADAQLTFLEQVQNSQSRAV